MTRCSPNPRTLSEVVVVDGVRTPFGRAGEVATFRPGRGRTIITVDEPPRPGTSPADLAGLKTPFRAHGRVTAGNTAGLNDGATAAPRINRYGGAITVGHPLAASGVRLMNRLARQFEDDPSVRFGPTTMGIGPGMGGAVIRENQPHARYGTTDTAATAQTGAAI